MSAAKTRINMRVSEDNLALIKEAAEASGQDMTSFVLGAALDRARAVVLEARVTRLSAAEAARFEAALDRARAVVLEARVTRLSAAGAARFEAALDSDAEPAPELVELLRATQAQLAMSRQAARA